jgi:Xaa-Pro aminopeptidase
MTEQPNSDFFINNRNNLKKLFMGTAPIILTANGILQQNSDNTYAFRQDSSFWYFTGLDIPNLIFVIDRDKEYLIIPKLSSFSEVADGSINRDQIIKISGINDIYESSDGWDILTNRIKKVKHVAILKSPGGFIESMGFYTNPAREYLINRIKAINSEVKFLDIHEHVSRLRSIKQEPEIELIKKAINITTQAISKIYKNRLKYSYEYEIEATVLSEFKNSNSIPGYSSIVANGKNACTLHYHQNHSRLDKSQLLLIDIGASVSNYTADITRTFALTESVSKRHQQVIDAAFEVQNFAKDLIRPGVYMHKYETEVVQFMGEKLRGLGLISIVNDENVRRYYPHSTSHFLGLDPHDIGNYELPLEKNMIITIEPGIYIPEESIGVRIEDDFLINDDGVICLSNNLPGVIN